MVTLGGSMFVHNAVEFDYCARESLRSLCELCDEVVVVDAQSTDDTVAWLREVQLEHPKLKIFTGATWDQGRDFHRLRNLANEAREHLTTDWHFMLQADEVLHERSFPFIRQLIQNQRHTSYMCRRLNLFGDLNHYLRLDLPQHEKPCSDCIIRLAKKEFPAHGDAESLLVDGMHCSDTHIDQIVMFHYGMVRRDSNFLNKIIDMQTWWFGDADYRVKAMKDSGKERFDWEVMKPREYLDRIPYPHPKFSERWAFERQQEKVPVTG